MTPRVILRAEAEAEIEEAYRWYEEQSPGLGREFLRTLDAAIASILRLPQSYPIVHKQVRRALIRRFPYAIFYLVQPESIVVVACFHVKRDPRYWQSRV